MKIGISSLLPIPKPTKRKNTKPQKAVILTASPYKRELEVSNAKKSVKIPKLQKLITKPGTDTHKQNQKENYCCVCNGYYFDKKGPKVEWVKSVRCQKWFHETCGDNPDICKKCLKKKKS